MMVSNEVTNENVGGKNLPYRELGVVRVNASSYSLVDEIMMSITSERTEEQVINATVPQMKHRKKNAAKLKKIVVEVLQKWMKNHAEYSLPINRNQNNDEVTKTLIYNFLHNRNFTISTEFKISRKDYKLYGHSSSTHRAQGKTEAHVVVKEVLKDLENYFSINTSCCLSYHNSILKYLIGRNTLEITLSITPKEEFFSILAPTLRNNMPTAER